MSSEEQNIFVCTHVSVGSLETQRHLGENDSKMGINGFYFANEGNISD